ncbi:MAG: RluA family pseudouridine synthase [Planctomycetes bacterium]|nr:RluA family pseudouridine synthase [Planctomycetota bacterium]
MPLTERQFTVPKDSPFCGGRIDRLVQELVGGGRAHIAGLFEQSCVELNGERILEDWMRIYPGDRVRVRYDQHRNYQPARRPRSHRGFTVMFEDRDCLVVDKAAEILTVPTRRGEPNTLVDLLGQYLRRSRLGHQAWTVHRLDRDVSGLLVFGKSEPCAAALRDQFAARKPERRYVAIVRGKLPADHGTFRSHLATDRDLNRYSTDDEEIGQLAITHYRVLQRAADTTLVEVRLETGRRNQIRVHFAEHGYPLLGDPRYGGPAPRHPRWPYRRVALHARTLGFQHPTTGQRMLFESRYPPEMVRFLIQVA